MTKEALQNIVEKTTDYNEVLLVNSRNPVELEYITDMLREMNISFRAEEEGKEQFVSLIESSDTGVSIYVDENRLDEAQELLTPLNADQQDCEEIASQEDELVSEQVLEVVQKATGVFKKWFVYPVLIIAAVLLLKFLDSIGFGEYIGYIIRLVFVR